MGYRAQSFAGLPTDWVCRGYRGSGQVEGLFDSLLGRTALVVGSGGTIEQIFDDVARFPDAIVFAVNDIGMFLPRVDHFVSLHSEKLLHWAAIRNDGTSKPIYPKFVTHTVRSHPAAINYHWEGITPLMPLSGYFAMQLAWVMGADLIILIGCPGDGTRRLFAASPKPGERYSELGIRKQIEDEMRRIPEFKRAVRSTSGWTKTMFGGPDD